MAAFGAKVLDKQIVVDKNIITSTGSTTAITIVFLLLEKPTSKQNVIEVKKYMRFEL